MNSNRLLFACLLAVDQHILVPFDNFLIYHLKEGRAYSFRFLIQNNS